MFVGWGPQHEVPSLNYPESGLSTSPSSAAPYKWVVDDLSGDWPGYRSLPEDYAWSQIIRIPPSFSINLEYLRQAALS